MGSTVVELHGADAAEEVVVASVLGIAGGCREGRLQNKLVGLVVQTVLYVAPQETVDEGSLCLVVVP